MAFVLASVLARTAVASSPKTLLLLTKSSGFQHSAITRKDGGPSHVEKVLAKLAEENDFELVSTKDASWINAEKLAEFDAVVFYTTGDLTQAGDGKGLMGGDGEPPMSATGVADLTEWVRAGGAFLGFHSASDTFRGGEDGATPYGKLLGGEFFSHGRQFEGTLRVVDREHPTMAHIPEAWTVHDEWYVFTNLGRDRMHVLALLETEAEAANQELYDRAPYPVIWCSTLGDGRVFYNAMGHREDVWDREIFQAAFLDALAWALGRGEARAAPNYDDVVPGE